MQFTDQLQRKIDVAFPPQRIVSIVPSQTELLYDLGLVNEIAGITKFCVHPPHLRREKAIVGGTKKLHIEKIMALQPDLIIANKEENEKADILELEKYFPVWISDISNFEDALEMIRMVGELTGTTPKASELISRITAEMNAYLFPLQPLRTAYLIWKDPWMTIGANTFISDMMSRAGFINVFDDLQRYPEISVQMLVEKDPDLIILSSEPYPFKQEHIHALQQYLPHTRVLLADGEVFSWYGSRMQHSFAGFAAIWEQLKN